MEDSMFSVAKLNNGAIKHEISPRKNHLISLFKSLELTLTDKKKRYFDKVQSLVAAWEQIANFVSLTSSESPQPAFDFLFINTLRFVLRADWPLCSPALQTHLSVTLQRFINDLTRSGRYRCILEQCRVLESVVKDPWDNRNQAVLNKILQSQNVDPEDCIEYFQSENGKVIVVRLEMLLESKCEDIAIHLSKMCLDTINSFNEDVEDVDALLDFNQDEIDYITDIYFICLYKTKKIPELIAEIKKYQLDDGLRLLQRYRKDGVGGKYNEHCKNARVWKCNKKLIDLFSNTLLTNAVLHENLLESQSQLEDIITEWAAVQTVDGVLPSLALEMIRKFVMIAPFSKCIYPFCSFLMRNGNRREQDFNMVARCLIRAINQNMNEVEQHRVSRERDKMKETYNQLSNGYLLLSDLLNEYKSIYQECLLTSFSVTPSRDCLQTIEDFVTRNSIIRDPERNETIESATGNDVESGEVPLSSNINAEQSTEVVSSIVESQNPANETTSATQENCINEVSPVKSQNASEEGSSMMDKNLPSRNPSSSGGIPDTSNLNEIFESMGVANDAEGRIKDEPDSDAINTLIDLRNGPAPAYLVEVENLTVDDSIKTDLNTILGYKRYHTLTWELNWPELKKNCEQYLENFEKTGFDDVKLQYLDLDYNLFKDRPINYDEFGIEKGYEHYAFSPQHGDSEEEQSSTKKSAVSSYDSEEDIALIYRKRRKAIDSDSDSASESKSRKKRGRKVKSKDERTRRNSKRSDSASNAEDDIDAIRPSRSNPNSLKELRQFRFTSMKSLADGASSKPEREVDTKQMEELNQLLADSCQLLDCVEIPPVSPRFNVYDVILEETLVPSDSAKRLPKIEELSNYESLLDESIMPEPAPVKKPERKRKPPKEGATPRKRTPKVPKVKIPLVTRPSNPNQSYLASTPNCVPPPPYSTLLSNNDLFKRKYGNKAKNGTKEVSLGMATAKECVVQLPKLSDSFSHVKKSFVDPNVKFATFLSNCGVDKAEILSFTAASLETPKSTFGQGCMNADVNTTKRENDINFENVMRPDFTNSPASTSTTPQVFQQTSAETQTSMEQDANAGFDESVLQYVEQLHGLREPAQHLKTVPTTSKLVNAPAPLINRNSNPVNVHNDSNALAKNNSNEMVGVILNQYQSYVEKYPQYKDVPAPRKRSNAPNTPKRQKSKKKNPEAARIEEDLRKDEYLGNDTESGKVSQPACDPVSGLSYDISNVIYRSPEKLPTASSSIAVTSSQSSSTNAYDGAQNDPKMIQGSYLLDSIQNTVAHMTTYTNLVPRIHLTPVKANGHNKTPVTLPKKDTANGTLKALLMQGTTKANSSHNRAPQSQEVPASSADTRYSSNPPKTYNRRSAGQATAYSAMNGSQEGSTAQAANLQTRTSMSDTKNIYELPKMYNEMKEQTSKMLQDFTEEDLKAFEGLTNNFQVRIPRIDLKVDAATYSSNEQYTQFSKANPATKSETAKVISRALPRQVQSTVVSTSQPQITCNPVSRSQPQQMLNPVSRTQTQQIPTISKSQTLQMQNTMTRQSQTPISLSQAQMMNSMSQPQFQMQNALVSRSQPQQVHTTASSQPPQYVQNAAISRLQPQQNTMIPRSQPQQMQTMPRSQPQQMQNTMIPISQPQQMQNIIPGSQSQQMQNTMISRTQPQQMSTTVSQQNTIVSGSQPLLQNTTISTQPSQFMQNPPISRLQPQYHQTTMISRAQPQQMLNTLVSSQPQSIQNIVSQPQNTHVVSTAQSQMQNVVPISRTMVPRSHSYNTYSNASVSGSSTMQQNTLSSSNMDNYQVKNTMDMSPSVVLPMLPQQNVGMQSNQMHLTQVDNNTEFSSAVYLPNTQNIKNEPKLPSFMFATVDTNNSGEVDDTNVCISIPESSLPEALSYLSFIQNETQIPENGFLGNVDTMFYSTGNYNGT